MYSEVKDTTMSPFCSAASEALAPGLPSSSADVIWSVHRQEPHQKMQQTVEEMNTRTK